MLAAVAIALLLAGCANKEEDVVYQEQPVDELYNQAMDDLTNENYEAAAKKFDAVERQHPYSTWAIKGQLMSAFSWYKKGSYPEAVVTLQRFISLHPAYKDVDYAYYLLALTYYERITDVARDQEMTQKAGAALREVIRRFPKSKYAADAKPKLVLVRDQLAGKEMAIGRYYQNRGHYLAAINRFRVVVDKYQTTAHVPEALHRLTELYLSLGVIDEARKAAAVLGYNFPNSEWYKDSYALLIKGPQPVVSAEAGQAAKDESFLSRTWNWIF